MIHIATTHHRADLEHAVLLGTLLAAQIDPATIHLIEMLATNDGMRTSTAGLAPATITPRTHDDDDDDIDQAPPTSVEAAVLHRQTIADQLDDITAHVRGILTMYRELSKMVQRAILTHGPTQPAPRCSATGRDGADEWGDPRCWDIPTRSTLCARCYMRERRWRQSHGLPTREAAA